MPRLRVLGFAAAFVLTALNSVAAEENLTGVAGGTAPPDTPWSAQWERFGRAASEAGFDLTLLVKGELGSEEEILSAIRRNRVQVGGFTSAGITSVVPEMAILLMPYAFSSAAEQDFVLDNYLWEPMAACFAERGLVLLQWIDSGWAAVFATQPIATPDDIRGLRIRTSPNFAHQAFMRAIGADSVPLGLGDFIPALQSGLVDGGISVAVFYYATARTLAPHFTLTRHYRETGAMVANADWFAALSPEHQAALKQAFGAADRVREEVRDMETALIERMSGEGVSVTTLSEAQRKLWQSRSAPASGAVIDQLGEDGQALLDAIDDGRRAFREIRTD